MAKVITKEDVQAACEKAAAKATAAEMKRCIAAVKQSSANDTLESRDFKRGAKVARAAAVAAIKE